MHGRERGRETAFLQVVETFSGSLTQTEIQYSEAAPTRAQSTSLTDVAA